MFSATKLLTHILFIIEVGGEGIADARGEDSDRFEAFDEDEALVGASVLQERGDGFGADFGRESI